jgi:hypothetical protein
MFFDNNVIDTILVLAIVAIIGLWFYQNNNSIKSILNTHNQNALNSFNSLSNTPEINTPGVIVNDIEFPHEHNKTRLLTNQRGVSVGFHEQFKRLLPELGWRSFYLRNFNGLNSMEPDTKPKTVADNYLSCLSNTDNVYKYVNY